MRLGEPSRVGLPAEGGLTGAFADLNWDDDDDEILGMRHNGIRPDRSAIIYYSARDGISERCQEQLPAPQCESVAVTDFNGDGRPAQFRLLIPHPRSEHLHAVVSIVSGPDLVVEFGQPQRLYSISCRKR